MTFPDWDRKLALALTDHEDPQLLRFLRAWARAEGGHATFNPLNTTMPVASATNYNRVGVKNYPDELAGLAATLLTLRLPFYARLLRACRVGGLRAEVIVDRGAADLRVWGTGPDAISRVLASSR